jgi:hypothetical protein
MEESEMNALTALNLSTVLLWLAFALTIAAAVPRFGVPLWIPVLLLCLALLVRGQAGG